MTERQKTTSEALAEIGAAHEATSHLRRRRIVAKDGNTIGFMDCFEANDFVATAQAAA